MIYETSIRNGPISINRFIWESRSTNFPPPPQKEYLTPYMKIKHPLSNQKFQGLTHNAAKKTAELPYNETKYSRFESLSIDWKIMKIEICFTNQKMKMEVFEWIDLKKFQTQIESTFID